MNRAQWAERLPIIQAFVEGRPLEVFSGGEWTDADENGNFDFDPAQNWRLKPGTNEDLRVKVSQNEQNIAILFPTIHEMKNQIGELQLQVQKLETGKRDDEVVAEDGAAQMTEMLTRERDEAAALSHQYRNERDKYKAMWEASARESKILVKQRDQNAELNRDVDERVRQEVQLATDILRREYAMCNQENIKLIAQIRSSYAQEFEEDHGSPLGDLIRHTFMHLAHKTSQARKFKVLLERWLEMNNGNPVNPNDRRDLINETKSCV